ncbi:MAG TPA: HEAT repeat domain-containing protein [Anaerolineales bacterium]|nr:HEAT repeat domain-containing protein [Anaerolineales bacterium]
MDILFAELVSGDDERAERAALRIGAHGAAALPGLAALLESPNSDDRWWAVRTLGEIADPDVHPHLSRALQDPSSDVRQCAARALIAQPAPALIPHLTGCLESGDVLLTRLAGTALSAIGAEAVPALIEVLETGPQLARAAAARALAEIKDARTIPVFFRAVQDGDSPLVEYWAEVGLERLGIGMTFFDPG